MNHQFSSYDHIFFFTNGSIGDFLMTMLCAEEVRKKTSNSTCVIFTPRNASMLQELCGAYPNIQVRAMNGRALPALGLFVCKNMFGKNLVVRQGVFKKIPWSIEIPARLLSLWPMSRYVRFFQNGNEYRSQESGVVFGLDILVYENLARLVGVAGVKISSEVPVYRFNVDERVVKRHGLAPAAYLVVHPSGSSPVRSLPPSRWRSVLALVAQNNPSLKIVITGSAQDDTFIQTFLPRISQGQLINLSGKLSMPELAQVISSARGFLGVDTGVTHLAGVLRQKSVVIGNLSNPCWLPRYNERAVILTEPKSCTCDGSKGGNCFYEIGKEKYYKCMLDISDEAIVREIQDMLMKHS